MINLSDQISILTVNSIVFPVAKAQPFSQEFRPISRDTARGFMPTDSAISFCIHSFPCRACIWYCCPRVSCLYCLDCKLIPISISECESYEMHQQLTHL